MVRYIASIFLVFVLLSCGGSDSPSLSTTEDGVVNGKTLGTWILTTQTYDDTNGTVYTSNYTFANLANRNIKHIDQLISFEQLADKSYRIANEEGLMSFIQTAVNEGVRVNLLINDADFCNEANYEASMSKIESIIDFNTNLYSNTSTALLGIKLRVNLERSTGWALNAANATYNYLNFLFQAKATIAREGSNMLLSVDVDDAWDSGSYSISFNRKDKNLTYHIIDIVDYITVLSFSQDVGGVMALIDDEMMYLRDEQLTNRLVPALAVSPIQNRADTFYGLSDTTLFWSMLNSLQLELQDDLRVPMIMIENFEYFDQIPPVPAN